VLAEKYLKDGEKTEAELFARVARALASVEKPEIRDEWEAKFLGNLHAGAIGAAFFVGATNIGEKLSGADMPQQAMLDGIHLAMGCALVVGVVVVMFALRLKAHQK